MRLLRSALDPLVRRNAARRCARHPRRTRGARTLRSAQRRVLRKLLARADPRDGRTRNPVLPLVSVLLVGFAGLDEAFRVQRQIARLEAGPRAGKPRCRGRQQRRLHAARFQRTRHSGPRHRPRRRSGSRRRSARDPDDEHVLHGGSGSLAARRRAPRRSLPCQQRARARRRPQRVRRRRRHVARAGRDRRHRVPVRGRPDRALRVRHHLSPASVLLLGARVGRAVPPSRPLPEPGQAYSNPRRLAAALRPAVRSGRGFRSRPVGGRARGRRHGFRLLSLLRRARRPAAHGRYGAAAKAARRRQEHRGVRRGSQGPQCFSRTSD